MPVSPAAAIAPEFRLFCLALRRPQTDATGEELRRAVAARPDWGRIAEGAHRHAVAPLLLAGLLQSAAALPQPIAAELRRQSLSDARRALGQAAELRRLLALFAAASIRILILKGVALSTQLYGKLAMRGGRDIDLLTDPDRFDDAEAVLREAGYRHDGPSLSPRQDRAYRHWCKEIVYLHPPTGTIVELHRRFTEDPALLPCDFEALWRGHQTVSVEGLAVPVLPERQLGLYLCVHGAEHMWERLRWLTDLAALWQRPGAAESSFAAAREAGLAAPVLHALLLAHGWLGVALDDAIPARARSDATVRRLDRLLAGSYHGAAWSEMPARRSPAGFERYSLRQRLYRLHLKPGWHYRLNRLYRELASPADWAAWPLPDRLFWLYPALRPFGWLLRRLPLHAGKSLGLRIPFRASGKEGA